MEAVKLQGVVGRTPDGREIYGRPGTLLDHLPGQFVARDPRVWAGGRVTMPYWADGVRSPYLTDDEIERYCTTAEQREVRE